MVQECNIELQERAINCFKMNYKFSQNFNSCDMGCFLNIYLFLREREREREQAGGRAERERDRGSEADSALTEPNARLQPTSPEIMTGAKIRYSTN